MQNELLNDLKKIKPSTLSPIFKVAHSILSDNRDLYLTELNNAKLLEEVDVEKYEDWPLFSFIRENEELDKLSLEVLN